MKSVRGGMLKTWIGARSGDFARSSMRPGGSISWANDSSANLSCSFCSENWSLAGKRLASSNRGLHSRVLTENTQSDLRTGSVEGFRTEDRAEK